MTPGFILTDIEGTTTSISFVHDVLFPYAYERLPNWVKAHAQEERVRQAILGVQETILRENGKEIDWDGAITQLLEWIKSDRKQSDLKALQGWIWEDGYRTAAFTSHIYLDVKPALSRWKEKGLQMGVYSSGSVDAQKLLFKYTEEGDLLPFFSAFFDTRVGHKRETESYLNISSQLGVPADEILFLSDVPEELDAAKSAGFQVMHIVRHGTIAVDRYQGVGDFSSILP